VSSYSIEKRKLSKHTKLKSKKLKIDKIFQPGKIIFSTDKKLKVRTNLRRNAGDCGIKFSVAISKKAGNAVWRNRIKRLIREAHRLNNKELLNYCIANNVLLEVVFTSHVINEINANRISLKGIESTILDLHARIKSELTGAFL